MVFLFLFVVPVGVLRDRIARVLIIPDHLGGNRIEVLAAVGIPITIARTGLVDQIITCHSIRLGIKPHPVLVDADGNVPVRRDP